MGARLHHVCTFSSSVCNKKHVNRMIVRMKLVARGNESSDNLPTLNLPGCRKPLAVVVCVTGVGLPLAGGPYVHAARTCVQTFPFFFFSFLFFSSFSNGEQKFALDFYLPILFFFSFFFSTDTFDLSRVRRRYT